MAHARFLRKAMPTSILFVFLLICIFVQQSGSVSVRQNAGCSFHMRTNGSMGFPVGQLPSGQGRAGSDMAPALFTWFGDAFVDQQGRGCWWTPPTNLLQCDTGQMPDHEHEIDCNGQLSFKSQTTFYECETGDGDQVNIYTTPSGVKCNYVTLICDDCRPDCDEGGQAPAPAPNPGNTPTSNSVQPTTQLSSAEGSPSPSPSLSETPSPGSPGNNDGDPSASTPVTGLLGSNGPSASAPESQAPTQSHGPSASPTTPPEECEPDLEGQSESPHMMVPVDSAHPDQPYGPSYYGQISTNASTFYNFDVPGSDAGKTCTLFFDFAQADATSNGYMWSGTGEMTFEQMSGPAGADTTYSNRPGVFMELKNVNMEPGNKYVINTFPCPAGDRITFHIKGQSQPSQDVAETCLYYLQEHKPVPMGLFMSKC